MVHGVRWGAAMCYLLTLATLYTAAVSAKKKDRDVSGLYPFPRVGRNLDQSTLTDYIKRQGLIPFPRVGRGSISADRSEEKEDANFWLSPRHAKAKKMYNPNELTLLQIDDPAIKSTVAISKDISDDLILESNDPLTPARYMW